jgi:hypothetical protein
MNYYKITSNIICPVCNYKLIHNICTCKATTVYFDSGCQVYFSYKGYYTVSSFFSKSIMNLNIFKFAYGERLNSINIQNEFFFNQKTESSILNKINEHFKLTKQYIDNIIFI